MSIDFADPKIVTELRPAGAGQVEITLRSASFASAVALGFGAHDVRLSDNWFDLHAGEPRTVVGRLPVGVELDELRAALRVTSLWHSYQSCPR